MPDERTDVLNDLNFVATTLRADNCECDPDTNFVCFSCSLGWIVQDAIKEIERLRKLIAQLPTTKDGVTVVPGMALYTERIGGVTRLEVISLDDLSSDWPATVRMPTACGQASTYRWHVQGCYSTREAAEAEAKEKA